MDFYQMGKLDFQNEISKSSGLGDKAITLRLDEGFAEFQSLLASNIGMSRQSFLSNIVAEYTVEAVADYLIGYYECTVGDIDVSNFLSGSLESYSDEINGFKEKLQMAISRKRIEDKAWVSYEGDDKKEYEKIMADNFLRGKNV